MAKTKTEAKAELKEWAAEFEEGAEVAVVQNDASRKIGVIVGKPTVDLELNGQCGVRYGEGEDSTMEPIARIRKRAVESKKTNNPLRVQLTNDEKLELGGAVADGLATVGALEAELATVKKQYQGKIQAAESDVSAKSELLRNGYEIRPTECRLTLDFDTGKALEIRVDTDERVEYRALRTEERERELRLFPEMHVVTADEVKEAVASAEPAEPLDPPTAVQVATAVELLRETGRASVTMLQRRMELGYTAAMMLMDALEHSGVVGPAKPNGETRDIVELPPEV